MEQQENLQKKNIWLIIPAQNEEKNIGDVLDRCRQYSKNIVVVDDGSTDKTFDIAEEKDVIVLKHLQNFGKGKALKTGCDYAVHKKADIIITIDSDGQHKPEDIPFFIKELEENDIVFGFRIFDKDMPKPFKIGNNIINTTIGFLYGKFFHDSQCGYRAFTSQAYKSIRWSSDDYSVESEMMINAIKNKLRCSELHIETIYKDNVKGTNVFDAMKIMLKIIWWRF